MPPTYHITKLFGLLILLPLTMQARPIPIVSESDLESVPEQAQQLDSRVSLQYILDRLVSSISFSPSSSQRVAAELLAELHEQPQDSDTCYAMQICRNWAKPREGYEDKIKTEEIFFADLFGATAKDANPEVIMAQIALAALSHPPTRQNLQHLQESCDALVDSTNSGGISTDTEQPLLHRFAALLSDEMRFAHLSSCQPISLLLRYIVAAGHNINTLNRHKQTVLDIVLDQVFPHREKHEESTNCAIYRRPNKILNRGVTGGVGTHLVDAATFLIELGARHGIGYLRNTKRTPQLSPRAAQREARFFCSTPHTTLASALLSKDEELIAAHQEELGKKEIVISILSAATISSNSAILRDLQKYQLNLHTHAPLIWESLAHPLHDSTRLLDDVRELLSLHIPLNKRDSLGNTPLHLIVNSAAGYPANSSQWQLVALLIKHGASINARNGRGDTPLSAAPYALQQFMLAVKP